MTRRNILKTLISFLSSVTFVSFAYPMVKFLSPLKGTTLADKVVIKKSELIAGSAKNITFKNKPIMIIHRLGAGKGIIALSRVCTHLGCLVNFDKSEQKIICPCHAAKFNIEGNVLSGPAPKSLERIPLRVEPERVIIG
ncbi:MAG: ubiquinol-cytochrome c reductase iron-sulfur subunit [Thermodesulfovibrionales bacterium]